MNTRSWLLSIAEAVIWYVFIYFWLHGKIDTKTYSEMFSIDRSTAYRDLADLLEKGIIYKKGKAKATTYLLK